MIDHVLKMLTSALNTVKISKEIGINGLKVKQICLDFYKLFVYIWSKNINCLN